MKRINSRVFMGAGDQSLAVVGHLFLQLNKAIELLANLQQPPMCTEDREVHEQFKEDSLEWDRETRRIAAEIYVALTGRAVVNTKESKNV